MSETEIRRRLALNQIPFHDGLPAMLSLYLDMLKDWNSRMDLTAVSDDEEMVDRHFVDSLVLLKSDLPRENSRMIDVGTGAGFPGLVLAMARPDLKITLLDAQRKRLDFLQAVGEAAGLSNITPVHARAEDGARRPELREQFDYASARALAPLNVLCEYLLPYVRTDGLALCWKGPALRDEMESGKKAARLLGGQVEMPIRCSVYGRDWDHMILPVRKVQQTPRQYPRKAGTPKSRPLGV